MPSLLETAYQETLGRAGDEGGLKFYQDAIDRGDVTIEQVRQELSASDESDNLLSGNYLSATGGTLDDATQDFYQNKLASGELNRGQIRQEIAQSDAGRNALETIYQNQLGRDSDVGGLAYYTGTLAGGRTIDEIRDEINQSVEGQQYTNSQGLIEADEDAFNETAQYGLSGSEAALESSLRAALGLIESSAMTARDDLTSGRDLSNAEYQRALAQATGTMDTAYTDGRRDFATAQEYYDQFANSGNRAFQQMADYTGASGVDAQQAAYDAYRASPGQNYLVQQAEQASLRNAAATGGLGGGRVQQELQTQAMGLAQQDFANSFDRLGRIADTGQQATAAQSNLQQQMGANRINQGINLSNLQTQSGAAVAGNQFGTGTNMANIAGNAGNNAANNVMNTGQLLSGGRTRAGEQIAANLAGQTTNMANMINNQGVGLANMTGTNAGQLAGILSGSGENQAISQQKLAEMLSGLSQAQLAAVAGAKAVPANSSGIQNLGSLASGAGAAMQGYGSLGGGTTAQAGRGIANGQYTDSYLGGGGGGGSDMMDLAKMGMQVYAMMSDERLKTNIVKVGVIGRHNLYTWDWTEKGKEIVDPKQPRIGVMAQEAMKLNPEAVVMGKEGYLQVKYSELT